MNQQEKSAAAQTLILTHTSFATAAALIPIPIADVAAVSAIHIDMLRQLAKVYGVAYADNAGKTLISAIGSSILARMGASAIKAIPGIGTIIGGITGVAISATTTYALGQTFKWHFENGGDFFNMDIEKAKKIFQREMVQGKKVAMETTAKDGKMSIDKVTETLETLADLQKKGIITEEDFNTQKQRLLSQL